MNKVNQDDVVLCSEIFDRYDEANGCGKISVKALQYELEQAHIREESYRESVKLMHTTRESS